MVNIEHLFQAELHKDQNKGNHGTAPIEQTSCPTKYNRAITYTSLTVKQRRKTTHACEGTVKDLVSEQRQEERQQGSRQRNLGSDPGSRDTPSGTSLFAGLVLLPQSTTAPEMEETIGSTLLYMSRVSRRLFPTTST